MLTAKFGGRKIQFTDAERRRLAVRAKMIGRKFLSQLETLVTPDTLLRWHREGIVNLAKRSRVYCQLICVGILERADGHVLSARHLLPTCKGHFSVVSFGLRVKVVTTMLE